MFRPDGLDNSNFSDSRGVALRFSRVRDRLFYALFYRISITYARLFPLVVRRIFEFVLLLSAILSVGLLLYIHTSFSRTPTSCLDSVKDIWPKDGILRIELVYNLSSSPIVFTHSYNDGAVDVDTLLSVHHKRYPNSNLNISSEMLAAAIKQDELSGKKGVFELLFGFGFDFANLDEKFGTSLLLRRKFSADASNDNVFEYAIEYGFLRLSPKARKRLNIETMVIQIDPQVDTCFGQGLSKYLLDHFLGFEDVLMSNIKQLAEREQNQGYLRNVATGEHFKFVNMWAARVSYIGAGFVMILFTISISMLLRYTHHQIFILIIDLLQMLETNVGLAFPATPLLTVILALVGIEAIMSEFFSDATTAFYIIVIVWVADQFEVIACHTSISRRHWLRFFYLYHFAFYAYHYRFNGQYSGLALIASWLLIQHSMIYFFHHYELPAVLHQAQVQSSQGNDPSSLEYIETLLEELLPTPHLNNNPPENSSVSHGLIRSSSGSMRLYPVQNLVLNHVLQFLHGVRERGNRIIGINSHLSPEAVQ